MPVSALTAIMAGTRVIFTVENVSKRSEGYVVQLRTPFTEFEDSHLEQRQVEVAFACADPRLLQIGARWIGVVIGTEAVRSSTVASPLEQGHLWLVPGFLLPERYDLTRAMNLVPAAAIN